MTGATRRWRTPALGDRARMGMAGVALAGIFAVSLGTGYQASKPLLTSGSALLNKGRTVVRMNAATGRAEASVEPELARDLAEGGNVAFQTVAMPDGSVVVVNKDTNEVSTVDPDTMKAATSAPIAGEPGEVTVAAAGDQLYLVDAAAGQVQLIDPATRQPRGDRVAVGKLAGSVVDGSGALWVLDSAKGTLTRVRRGAPDGPVQLPRSGGGLRLTSVGGNPVVTDAASQTAQRLVASTGVLQDPVPLDGARPDRALVANQPGAPGSTVWLVVPETGALVGADLNAHRSFSVAGIGPEGGSFEAPVVNGSRVFVVEASHHVVKVVDAGSRTVVDTFTVPGQSRHVEIFAKDGEVWLNDPLAREATIVDASGRRRRIDKGTGNGIQEEQPQPAPQPETPPSPTAGPAPQTEQAPPPRRERPVTAAPVGPQAAPSLPPTQATTTSPSAAAAIPAPVAPARVGVPGVEGLPQAQACAKVQSVGLTCAPSAAPVHSAQVQPGVVLSQDPAAGSTLDQGAAVSVVVNPPPPPDTRPVVPAVTGRQQASACQAVVATGLACTPVFGDDPANNETNTVWRQSPAPGTRLAAGSAVTVTYTVKRIPLIQLRALNREGVIMRIWYMTTNAAYAQKLATEPVDGGPKYKYAGGDTNLACYRDQGPGMVQIFEWYYSYGDSRHAQHYFGYKAPPPGPAWRQNPGLCWVFPSDPGTGARPLHRMRETANNPPAGEVSADGRGRVHTFDPPPNAYTTYGFVNDETWWVRSP